MTERVKKAIDIFLDAINSGTLAKGNCGACAVGNLIAHECGITPDIKERRHPEDFPYTKWQVLFCTQNGKQYLTDDILEGTSLLTRQRVVDALSDAHKYVSKTDFSIEELAKIEYAFEMNTKIKWNIYSYNSKEAIRADQIAGLKAVVEVMLTFDDCKESVEEVFTQKAELIPINN